jgi:hypothetical protein
MQTTDSSTTIDASIQCFKIYITGYLAFYAMVLGKPESSNYWCTWCDSLKGWYGVPDLVQNSVKWTCEKLKQAKRQFDNRTARSKKTNKGVSAGMLLDGVEPEDYIFPVLHDQMGLVNKSLEHLLSFSELHIEKLPDGHTQTRKELLDAQEARESATADKKSFNETDKVRLDTFENEPETQSIARFKTDWMMP